MRSKRQQAVTLAEATAQKRNNQNGKYHNSHALSRQKSLPEKLVTELTAIWFYSQNPILCQAEYKQAFRLFESTLRKYLAVKNFYFCHGFSESGTTDSGTSTGDSH